MKHYKVNNEIRAIEKGQEFLVQSDWIELSEDELQAELAPSAEELQEQLDAESKQAKELALSTITVTTTSGKVFDGKPQDIPLMSGAIQASEVLGMTEAQWKLHDNTVATVTLAELKEALAMAMVEIGKIKTEVM